MKKITIFAALLISGTISAGNSTTIQTINPTPNSITIEFKPGTYESRTVQMDGTEAMTISIEKGTPLLKKRSS